MPSAKKTSKRQPKAGKPEEQSFREHLRAVTPSASAHRLYLRKVVEFASEYNDLIQATNSRPDQFPIRTLNVVRSDLFSRDYLVAYLDAQWFLSNAAGCDAAATPEFRIGPLRSPPLVLAPETKIRAKGVAFRSILEHEFVHLNQALLGVFPPTEKIGKNPIQSLFKIT